jgi:hypothetical protein
MRAPRGWAIAAPAKTRFKRGQSGNPKGRPKGAKSFSTVLALELDGRVAVNENGKRKTITKRQVIGKQLVNKAAGGDLKAISSLLNETRDHDSEATGAASPAPARPEDRAIMDGILERLSGQAMPPEWPLKALYLTPQTAFLTKANRALPAAPPRPMGKASHEAPARRIRLPSPK